jgi:HEAT repeat protein
MSESIEALLGNLSNPDVSVWRKATTGLAKHGKDAIPHLIPHMKADDPIGPRCVMALCGMGVAALDPVLKACEDRNSGILGHAPSVLGVLGAMDPSTAEKIAAQLTSENPGVRQSVAFAMSQMGENGKKHLDKLTDAASVEQDADAIKMLNYTIAEFTK